MHRLPMTVALATLAIATLALNSPDALAQKACDGKTKTVRLGVHGKNKAPKSVRFKGKDASDFRACIGDTIVWRVPNKDRTVIVEFPEDAPFVGDRRLIGKNGQVKAVINNADSGKTYRYYVEFKNGNKMEAHLTIG